MQHEIDREMGDDSSELSPSDKFMNGRYKKAMRRYNAILQRRPDDALAQLELAGVLAAAGKVDQALSALSVFSEEELNPHQLARYRTAQAYARAKESGNDGLTTMLKEAVELDPEFSLAHLSLGRQLLFVERDPLEAKAHFEKAATLADRSVGAGLGLVTLAAESGDYASAFDSAIVLVKRFPLEPRPWFALLISSMLRSRAIYWLVLLTTVVALFISYVGPSILATWMVFTVINMYTIRRTSPRFAVVFPAIFSAGLVLAYIVRWIVLGRIFP